MTTTAHPHHAHSIGATDTGRRIWAIVGGSSGNLVEWYDFYVYSFTALYFASEFFPAGDQTTQLLNAAGVFGAGFLMRPHRQLAVRPYCRQARPPNIDDDRGDPDVRGIAARRRTADVRDHRACCTVPAA